MTSQHPDMFVLLKITQYMYLARGQLHQAKGLEFSF